MYLSDYDPDDPPASTHYMETTRLLGKTMMRLPIAIIAAFVLGVDLRQFGLLHLPDLAPASAAIMFVLIVWSGWPLLRGIEHAYHDIRETFL